MSKKSADEGRLTAIIPPQLMNILRSDAKRYSRTVSNLVTLYLLHYFKLINIHQEELTDLMNYTPEFWLSSRNSDNPPQQ